MGSPLGLMFGLADGHGFGLVLSSGDSNFAPLDHDEQKEGGLNLLPSALDWPYEAVQSTPKSFVAYEHLY